MQFGFFGRDKETITILFLYHRTMMPNLSVDLFDMVS